MTTDELKKEAEESFEKYRVTDIDYVVSPYSDDEGEKKIMFNNEYDAEEEYFRLYSKGYLASAEPREKKIKSLGERCLQLQKDKGELIDKTRELERKIASIRGSHRVDLAKLNARIEQVERLKKENAELRKDKKELCHSISEGGKACVYLNEQLTKAKEIIKEYLSLDYVQLSSCDKVINLRDKTEQFLKSEVEK